MSCTTGDEMDSLQATLDFISGYYLQPPTCPVPDVHAETELLQMIDLERGVLELRDRSSEDDVTLDKFTLGFPTSVRGKGGSPCSSQDDVCSVVESAPWPEMPSQRTKRRRRAAPRKEEITELRKLAAKLTKKLEGMKAAAVKLEQASKQKGNIVEKNLWKDIASRQLTLRRGAEVDNMNLRDEIMAQAKYAANLKRMLKRRYSEEMLEMIPIMKRGQALVSKASADNERYFSELLEGTNHIYASVDGLFAKKEMTDLLCPGRTHQTFPETVNGMFIELMDKTQVPFHRQMTANAVWKALCGKKTRDGDIVEAKMCAQDTQHSDNIIRSYVSYTCNAAGHFSFVYESRVARRYVEEDRVVFVCRGLTEPISRSLGPLGLLFHETVVMVVRKGQTLASGGETAVIESHLWVTRCDDNKEVALKFRDTTYVDIAIKGWNKKLSLYSERIENILFDDALKTM